MNILPALNERLKQIIDFTTDGNVSEFAKMIGISQPRLNRLFTKDSRTNKIPSVPSEVIIRINEMFVNIDPDWLLTGRGEMLRGQNLNKSKQLFEAINKTKNTKNVTEEKGNIKGNNFDTKPKVQKMSPNKTSENEIQFSPKGKLPRILNREKGLVPYYDIDFAAGSDIATFDDGSTQPAYYMDIPEFSGCTAFRAYSDSMEKLIKSGSILFGTKILAWLEHLEYGQIYGIICNDGRRYLKYIRKSKNDTQYLLRSENKDYDDFPLPRTAIRSIWLIHGWLHKRT